MITVTKREEVLLSPDELRTAEKLSTVPVDTKEFNTIEEAARWVAEESGFRFEDVLEEMQDLGSFSSAEFHFDVKDSSNE